MGELHINIGGVLIVVGVIYGFYILWTSELYYEQKAFMTFLFLIFTGFSLWLINVNDRKTLISYKGDD